MRYVLSAPRGSRSLSSHLKRTVKIEGVKMGLLWEFVSKEEMADPKKLAVAIKALPIPLVAPRPLEEAISSAGANPCPLTSPMATARDSSRMRR